MITQVGSRQGLAGDGGGGGFRLGWGAGGGEEDGEDGAGAAGGGGGADADGGVVTAEDFGGDPEAEAGAEFALGGDEGFEEVGEGLRVDAEAGIGDETAEAGLTGCEGVRRGGCAGRFFHCGWLRRSCR